MERNQLGFTCHPCMGVSVAVSIASVMGAVLAGDLKSLPGAPAHWLGWTLLGVGFVIYVVAGFAAEELIFFLGLLGLGLPWAIWWALEQFDVVGSLVTTTGPWAWYVLYAYALTPVLLTGALFLAIRLRNR